jgi:TRAP-type uncharacterized transport system fused permease subunit
MFIIPFVFAFYPELLLIADAQIDPNSPSGGFLPGYDGEVHLASLIWLCTRIALALYMVGSSLARFDRTEISSLEQVGRILVAILLVWKLPEVYAVGLILAALILVFHARKATVLQSN